MSARILEFPQDALERRALRILRDRKAGRVNHSLTPVELEQAIESIKQSDPNHPILQYLQRPNDLSEMDAS